MIRTIKSGKRKFNIYLRSLSPIRTHDVQPQTKWVFLLRSELFSILENRVLKIKKYFIFVRLLYRVESLIEHFSPKENTRKPTGILVNFYCMTVRKLCRISISREGIPTRGTNLLFTFHICFHFDSDHNICNLFGIIENRTD
jgi:hypothetical protein